MHSCIHVPIMLEENYDFVVYILLWDFHLGGSEVCAYCTLHGWAKQALTSTYDYVI